MSHGRCMVLHRLRLPPTWRHGFRSVVGETCLRTREEYAESGKDRTIRLALSHCYNPYSSNFLLRNADANGTALTSSSSSCPSNTTDIQPLNPTDLMIFMMRS